MAFEKSIEVLREHWNENADDARDDYEQAIEALESVDYYLKEAQVDLDWICEVLSDWLEDRKLMEDI